MSTFHGRNDLGYLQRQRAAEEERVKKAVERARMEQGGVKPIEEKFTVAADGFEDALKQETVGLSSLAEYATKRERVAETMAQDMGRAFKRRRIEAPIEPSDGGKKLDVTKLSFLHDEAEKEEEEAPVFVKKSLKDPTVNTSFLPDRARDEARQKERILQKQLWLDRQEKLKAEDLRVDFHFFDGTTHSHQCTIKKGQTVKEVLEFARKHFEELRKLSSDKLILVKDNWIVPSYLTFYELTENFSGPKRDRTFAYWDIDSNAKHHFHIPKVMERKFYEKNSHIYPYSLWEVFDEFKQKEANEEREREEKKAEATVV